MQSLNDVSTPTIDEKKKRSKTPFSLTIFTKKLGGLSSQLNQVLSNPETLSLKTLEEAENAIKNLQNAITPSLNKFRSTIGAL